jgi:hypothetical protein
MGINWEYVVMIDSNKFILKCQKLKISGNVNTTRVQSLSGSFLNVCVVTRPGECFVIDGSDSQFSQWLECFYRAESIL